LRNNYQFINSFIYLDIYKKMERFQQEMHFSKNANKLNRTFLIYDTFDKIPINDYLYMKFDKEFNRQLY